MEKTWLKNLEIGSLTLNLEMIFHSNEMGILPPKSLGRDVKTNEEVETQIAEMWIVSIGIQGNVGTSRFHLADYFR